MHGIVRFMHIAVFTDYYLPTLGGVQTSIKAQKDTLEAAGHTVTVFCPLHEPSDDPTVVRLPTSSVIKPDGYPFCWPPRKVINAGVSHIEELGDIDIIHVHSEMGAAFAGVRASEIFNIPLVQSMHTRIDAYVRDVLPMPHVSSIWLAWMHKHFVPRSSINLEQTSYTRTRLARRMWRVMVSQANHAQHVIVPSHHFAQKLQDQGVTKPLTVLSNGLDPSLVDKLHTSSPRHYSPGEDLRILWCSRMSNEKRPLVFLKAMKQLPDSVTVDMYGDGPNLPSVRRYIKHHRLGDRVHLHGGVPQSTVVEAMRDHHIFVLSSYDFDNQPMTLLEATAAGTPVVYCDADLGEVIPDDGGLLTNKPFAKNIAEAIRYLLENPSQVSTMSSHMLSSQTRTVQSPLTEQLLEIYESLR